MNGEAQPTTGLKVELPAEMSRELGAEILRAALEKAGVMEAILLAVQAQIALRGLIDKPEAARYLGISVPTLEVWLRKEGDRGGRGVPHLKIGETVRFKISSLDAWATQHEVNQVLPRAA
jgi:excisionase family DNA binding protein